MVLWLLIMSWIFTYFFYYYLFKHKNWQNKNCTGLAKTEHSSFSWSHLQHRLGLGSLFHSCIIWAKDAVIKNCWPSVEGRDPTEASLWEAECWISETWIPKWGNTSTKVVPCLSVIPTTTAVSNRFALLTLGHWPSRFREVLAALWVRLLHTFI